MGRVSRRTLVTAAMVVGLLVALRYATYLSYNGSESLEGDFAYQSAVVAAQRDLTIYQSAQFYGAPPEELGADERLLLRDFGRIDSCAKVPQEHAPAIIGNLQDRRAISQLTEALLELQEYGSDAFDATVRRNQRTRDVSNAMFAFVALLFAVLVGRLRRTIDEGRDLVERLQRAFISTRRSMPGVDVGNVLISATRGSNVGGDTYDAFTFDGQFGVFLVADVSGKGIDAAVDTAFIKFTIRTLFFEDRDPARILTKFASIYDRTSTNPETFVVLFLGIVDLASGVLRYASAGHEPAWVISDDGVEQLPPTGAIVGIGPGETYEAGQVALGPGDALVVSTDGLTESRDSRGGLLGAQSVRVWLSDLTGSAQSMADEIVRRLRKRSSNITDDLAILVVRYEPAFRTPGSSTPVAIPLTPERESVT